MMSFEEKMERLEKIVAQLEEESLPLETTMEYYEEGVRLLKECNAQLVAAEEKMQGVRDDRE